MLGGLRTAPTFSGRFVERRLNKRVDGLRPLVAACPAADRHGLLRSLTIACHQHIGNLLELGLADLISNLLLALVHLGLEACGRQPAPDLTTPRRVSKS